MNTTLIWNIDGQDYRRATSKEIENLRNEAGAPHVTFACLCGHKSWSAKNLTLTREGGFSPVRNIFYDWDNGPECSCPASNLVCVVPIEN